MLLLVNHIKLTKTLYWNWYLLRAGNYKSASRQLQNNTVNGAMSVSINHVINLWIKKFWARSLQYYFLFDLNTKTLVSNRFFAQF